MCLFIGRCVRQAHSFLLIHCVPCNYFRSVPDSLLPGVVCSGLPDHVHGDGIWTVCFTGNNYNMEDMPTVQR